MNSRSYDSAVAAQFPVELVPNQLEDVQWVLTYKALGASAGAPILLSMGENWEGPSPALRALLAQAPCHLNGYQFSLWGEPNLVNALTEWFIDDYQPDPDIDFRVAACWSGTRSTLFDIGQIIGEIRPGGTLIYATPGYDYGDVMCTQGLIAREVSVLDAKTGRVSYDTLADALNETTAAIILNVQHNPVAHQWPEIVIRKIFEKCLQHGIIPVFDDAHKAIINQDVQSVNAVRLWFEISSQAKSPPDWYLVRSLGKQLNCNGWGVGLLTGSSSAIEHLVLHVRPRREYAIQGAQQWAISQHLFSTNFRAETAAFAARIEQNRLALSTLVPRFGALQDQICTPFSWFPLPERLSRKEIMYSTGVLLGGLAPSPLGSKCGHDRFARIYLGAHQNIISVALTRLGSLFDHV